MLDKFEKFNRLLSSWFEWVAAAGLLAMMVIIVIDVFGSKVLGSPLFGAMDLVTLSQAVAIAFACAITLIIGRHIRVEFIVDKLPPRAQAVIDSIMTLLGLALFIIIVWRLFILGQRFQATGQGTGTAYIPVYPFAYAIGVACIPVCLVLLHSLLKSLTRMVQR